MLGRNVFICICIYTLVTSLTLGCASNSLVKRSPSAKQLETLPDVSLKASRDEIATFEKSLALMLLPESERRPFKVSAEFIQNSASYCRSADYGPFLTAPDSPAKQTFLMSRINRPFFYIEVADEGHYGRAEDLQELLCHLMARAGVDSLDRIPKKMSMTAGEILAELALPYGNFVHLSRALSQISDLPREDRSSVLLRILQDARFNANLARALMLSFYRLDLPENEMRTIFKVLFRSAAFQQHPNYVLKIALAHLPVAGVDATYRVRRLLDFATLLKAQGPHLEMLRMGFDSEINQPQVTELYRSLMSVASEETRVALFQEVVKSRKDIDGFDSELQQMWQAQSTTAENRRAIIRTIMQDERTPDRFAGPTVERIVHQAFIDRQMSSDDVSLLLRAIDGKREWYSSEAQRQTIAKAMELPDLSPQTGGLIIQHLHLRVREDKRWQSDLATGLSVLLKRLPFDGEFAESWSRALRAVEDIPTQFILAKSALAKGPLRELELEEVGQNAVNGRNLEILTLILAQKGLPDQSYLNLAISFCQKTSKVNENERKFLSDLAKDKRASKSLKACVHTALTGELPTL